MVSGGHIFFSKAFGFFPVFLIEIQVIHVTRVTSSLEQALPVEIVDNLVYLRLLIQLLLILRA